MKFIVTYLQPSVGTADLNALFFGTVTKSKNTDSTPIGGSTRYVTSKCYISILNDIKSLP